ncbi:uncharacterized protein LOC132613254 [Lycium barbarum]|uniref:uncharacterized protein LOC132613254 n=1 Tax=Lycium barbarum TaxID=112863 RepID=UPI00293EF965|nr:uncharacterized protein LOC132613254 [Lycium barbarum]
MQAVVLYVVGDSPSIGAIERFISTQWNFASKPRVHYHTDDYFVVKFNSLEDKNEVLYSGPHTMNNRPVIIKPWAADFNFCDEVLRTIPIWFKFPNLPLNCWSMDSLSRISSGLGNPIYANACTTTMDRISFARVLIEVDITQPLPKKINVKWRH